MEAVLEFLRSHEVFSLFTIIVFGFLIGNIKIKGFSFDVSAVIFVALLFGHYGVHVPPVIETMGLVLFIFTVGIQAGPGFFDSFRSKGRKYIVMVALLVLFAFLLAVALKFIFDVPSDLLTGIVCGALTSTPGLSVAIEATKSPLASIGYGIAYPIGVIGVILFIKLLPKLNRVDLEGEYKRLTALNKGAHPEVLTATYCVEHDTLFGKRLADVRLRTMTGATVSRIKKGDDVIIPEANTTLEKGDLLRVVGPQEALDRVELLVGHRTQDLVALNQDYRIETLLVTNKAIVNQPISAVQMQNGCSVVVTRIRRSGIDFTPSPRTVFKFGDKLTVACREKEFQAVSKLLGNNAKALSDTDFLPIALGIVLGFLLGVVEISFGPSFKLSLGLTGGVLITALILSNLGKTGPILWTMTGPANNLLRQLGLLFFLAGVGTGAGTSLVATIQDAGVSLLIVGALITILPMFFLFLINKWFFKVNLFEFFGVVAGGMTSTPGLAACESMSFDETPSMVYATVYPVAMVALLLIIKILAIL